MPHRVKERKYLALVLVSMMHGLRNFRVIIGLSFLLLTCLVIFAHIWFWATQRSGLDHFSSEHLLWYIALNEWVIFSIPDIQNDIEEELRSGRLAYLLPRPISYLGAKFAEGMGMLLLYLLSLGPVAFLFAWIWTNHVPFSFLGFCFTVCLGLLAGVVGLIFRMLIGICAFWLQEVTPMNWIWEKFLFMLGGLILPLTTYPVWIQTIAQWTPFPSMLGARSALALHFSLEDAIWIILSLISWGIIGGCILIVVYRKGLKIVTIQGG